MLLELISPLTIPIVISLTAVFGVFVHDTQINKALITAVSSPAVSSDYRSEPLKLPTVEQHIHSESTSFTGTSSLNSQQPATQPRNLDDKKYVAGRRLMGNSPGNEYSWPSI